MTAPSRADVSIEGTLGIARMLAGALAAGMLPLALVSEWMAGNGRVGFLVAPAGLFGIVSPVIGYRLFHLLCEKVPAEADTARRHALYIRATLLSLGVTEAAALLGIVAFALSGELTALIGLVTHMILTGALWPTEPRLEAFLTPHPTSPGSRP